MNNYSFWTILLSLLKSIWVNLKLFPFSIAIKLPLWVHYKTCVYGLKRDKILLPGGVNMA